MASPRSLGGGLGCLIRWSFLASCVWLGLGLLLMLGGMASLYVAGWAAVYVYTVGLWIAIAAVLPVTTLVVSALIFRGKHKRWYWGLGKLDGPG
jgi:hypothetical protein